MSVDPDFVKELVELLDGSPWHMADRLAEKFPESEYGAGSHTKTGLYAVLEEYEDVLRREHGIESSWKNMRDYRATAIAWPDAGRQASTSFEVHRRVRGTDREQQMAKYLRMASREGVALSRTKLGRYRADEAGPHPLTVPLDERMRRRVSSILKSMLLGRSIKRDDWWTSKSVSEDSRRLAASVLRQLADEIDA